MKTKATKKKVEKKVKEAVSKLEVVYATGGIPYKQSKPESLKTVSYRGDERDTTQWMNDFCSNKGESVKNVSVTCDGRAYTAFISYWSQE